LTLKHFLLLVERHKERVKREDRRAGEMIAMFFNANRDTEKMPRGIDWTDVFPEWKEPSKEQTEEEMLEVMQALMASTQSMGDA
jgi:hypothetical protein